MSGTKMPKLLDRWRRTSRSHKRTDPELDAARARLGSQQGMLARFLADPDFERAVRANPVAEAARRGVPTTYAQWLSALDEERVAAFRRTQHMKRSAGDAP